jgi:phosphoribosylamine--glycine ligase
MKVLLVGSGGREHALAWKLKQSSALTQLFITPGNAGTAELGQNVPIPATDIFRLRCFAQEHKIDLTIVGPEDPIALGIRDLFEQAHLKIVAPWKKVAFLEASKVRAKEFMNQYQIPTAHHGSFTEYAAALAYVKSLKAPMVIKADGLAAGKGVAIAQTTEEADRDLKSYLINRRFGPASQSLVIEEFLTGKELSVFVASDGRTWKLLGVAQDYKRLLDADQGPNTGGMGAVSPVSWLTARMLEEISSRIIEPTFSGLRAEGLHFEGILYLGLIWTDMGPYVIEYNVRFGDPETQVLVPRCDFDLLRFYQAIAERKLHEIPLELRSEYAVCVVAASKGYPEEYETNLLIQGEGLKSIAGDALLFQAGTTLQGQSVLTSGGRVLNAVGKGSSIGEARERAYELIQHVHFPGMHYRRDIAKF